MTFVKKHLKKYRILPITKFYYPKENDFNFKNINFQIIDGEYEFINEFFNCNHKLNFEKMEFDCYFFKIDNVKYVIIKKSNIYIFSKVINKKEDLSNEIKLYIKENDKYYENCNNFSQKELILEERFFNLEKINENLLERIYNLERKFKQIQEI